MMDSFLKFIGLNLRYQISFYFLGQSFFSRLSHLMTGNDLFREREGLDEIILDRICLL